MDVLAIKSKLMKRVVSKLLGVLLYRKIGYKFDIQISDLDITSINDNIHIHINADADIKEKEFKKFTKILGVEE